MPELNITAEFKKELVSIINKHNIDTQLNTPDYIVAFLLSVILLDLQSVILERDKWFEETAKAVLGDTANVTDNSDTQKTN